MMFAQEFNVSRVFSLNSREELFTHEKMWTVCTSVADDEYKDSISEELKDKLKKTILFDFVDVDKFVPLSTTKFIELWYNNDGIKKCSCTTEIPYVFITNNKELFQLQSELGVDNNIVSKIKEISNLSSPTDIYIDKIYYDNIGNYCGISLSPTRINEKFFPGSQFSDLASKIFKDNQEYDIDILKNKIVIRPLMNYYNYVYSFPAYEGDNRFIDYKKFSYKKKEVPKREFVDRYIKKIKEDYELFDDEDVTYVNSLFDHEEQELDIEVYFNFDGFLDDILIYKREVKDFKVWRPTSF